MSIGKGVDRRNCSNPIDAAVLADYWLAALTGYDEVTVEEHLFNCDGCGGRSVEVGVGPVRRPGGVDRLLFLADRGLLL